MRHTDKSSCRTWPYLVSVKQFTVLLLSWLRELALIVTKTKKMNESACPMRQSVSDKFGLLSRFQDDAADDDNNYEHLVQ